ncbi:MAG TPA: F0F1 ATP synthase subunit epsilon [Gammaproteobacteria bacterium]
MSGFTLQLFDSRQGLRIDGVSSFVGEDGSGSFAILPRHTRFMTALTFGLARFRKGDESWQYLALPGALLYFADNVLTLFCRHFLIDSDYEQISQRLAEELLVEEEQLHEVKESLRRMEEAMLKRMWELGQQGIRLHE